MSCTVPYNPLYILIASLSTELSHLLWHMREIIETDLPEMVLYLQLDNIIQQNKCRKGSTRSLPRNKRNDNVALLQTQNNHRKDQIVI